MDSYKGDGSRKTFQLGYRWDNVTVEVDGVVQTIGTDQQTDPNTVDLLYNFNEKFIKFTNAPTAGQAVKIYGDAFIPIIASVRDQISIATYGEFQQAVVDKSITSVAEAQSRAKAELKKYSESVFEAQFKTTQKGLRVGQKITLDSTIRNITKTFKITRITGKARSGTEFEYTVNLLASGEITFTDMMVGLLSQDKQNIDIASNEVLQRLETFFEAVEMGENVTLTKTSPPYTWGPGGSNDTRWGFGTWG